ncbi:hypothetical protein A1O3_07778 [Capronia epimyces CBS 606.96]|uniref:Uncharacterized protein n=1 Tax=Capronia epimyces CBS 606.96 TaxID=1182542 RepID=W9XVW2_9EURO|nr:uncharacterized protein A1O3_07778 [Capronia epimyces CBS 606.96]EXJ81485.1 hypothetical protein A1O3_07778 [Capronia epimyces CBS 606.96]
MKALRSKQDHEDRPRKKMLLSSRANPPKPLKLAGPGLHVSLKSLLPSTPIPSPSLPSILPRHGKKPPKLNSRRLVRAILWLSVLIGVYYLATFAFASTSTSGGTRKPRLTGLTFLTSFGKTYEIVEALELPDHPTPLALADGEGKHHWTISIPSGLGFPLASSVYADICSQADEVARQVGGRGRRQNTRHGDYMQHDAHFLDVHEAQARHFLPRDRETGKDWDSAPQAAAEPNQPPSPGRAVCNKTLTYVLDATDAGLGSALLGMWLSYGLAEREGRSFFIDDTNFPYGNYSTFFVPPAPPACRLPPPSHRVPCPHQASHLVVSAATARWTFGAAFHEHHPQRDIYEMARSGFEALFKLRKEDDDYVRARAAKLRTGPGPTPAHGLENGLLGIHIRRGDRHPYEFAYQLGYLPPDRYLAVARRLVGQSERWKLMLASDDADMYDHIELPDTIRAQQRISLASKKSLGSGGLGWERGFFTDVFWSLGLPTHGPEQRRLGSPAPSRAKPNPNPNPHSSATQANDIQDYRTNPTKEALQLRELLGRAYLLDLAMLAQSDKVVCGVSSNACRILAVMLGWERAFENNDWTNVDGNHGWRALDY